MSWHRPVQAVLFDMDGLLIDSEPLWQQAELDVLATLNPGLNSRKNMPDTSGLRIDQVVRMWHELLQWQGMSQTEVVQRIIARTLQLIDQHRPLLPGVTQALELCRSQPVKIGLVSASPLFMLEQVLEMFQLRHFFDSLTSAEALPYSKPHPQVYLDSAAGFAIDPLNCVTLEDSVNGMTATKAARMRSIVIPAASQRSDPRWSLADVQLNSLQDLTLADLGIA